MACLAVVILVRPSAPLGEGSRDFLLNVITTTAGIAGLLLIATLWRGSGLGSRVFLALVAVPLGVGVVVAINFLL